MAAYLVNLDTGKIMDLLPDREEKSLENWLKTQPTIESKNCLCRLMRSWNVLSHISLEIQRRFAKGYKWPEKYIETNAYGIFTHVITHEFHHKGHAMTMARLLGYTPVDTDVMRF